MPSPTQGHRRAIMRLIGVFKLIKALLMTLAACAALQLTRPEVTDWLRRWSGELGVGPYRREIGTFVSHHLLALSEKSLWGVAIGAGLYAGLFATEGVGLLLDKLWAEWLAVVSTLGLIPLEVLHIIHAREEHHHIWVGIAALVVNILIAIYVAVVAYRRTRDAKKGANSGDSPPQSEGDKSGGDNSAADKSGVGIANSGRAAPAQSI